ncbi:stalk domain-containing protein [Paenibacillus glufosinatiresistens]|uniref:stalk domain-containing protein n=1 Tax=Paenibacillus glufosinatiresistens TaxID=3070657 RepID=UPI00286EABAA|nr:stalk domain-containing protein [Paenibacillus sp. YX.27]
MPVRMGLRAGDAAKRPFRLLLPALTAGMLFAGAAVSPGPTAAAASAAVPAAASTNAASGPAPFVQVTAGAYYSAALRADGTVWAWGRTLYGELGVLEPRITSSIQRPVRLAALRGIQSIATNRVGSQVGVGSDGSVWEWGAGTGPSALPKQVKGLAGITAAIPGFALQRNGTLWYWSHPLAADGTSEAAGVPRRIPGTYRFTGLTSWSGLVYGLDEHGAVWGFGLVNQPSGAGQTLISPARIAGLPAFKQISAYQNRLVGVDSAGRVWTAQVETDALYSRSTPGPLRLTGKPLRAGTPLKAAEAQLVDYNTLLIRTAAGELWTTGTWLTGRAGRMSGPAGVREAEAGIHHALAIDAGGRLWGVGGNQWGEAGSSNVNRDRLLYRPVPVLPAIGVSVNGSPLSSGYPADLQNGRVSVPLRDTIRSLGGSLTASGSSLAVQLGQARAQITAGSAQAEVNGRSVALNSPVSQSSGAVMIPAQLLALLGVNTQWDSSSGELHLDFPAAASAK